MKALSAVVGIFLMLGSVALTAQSGTPVGTGAPAGRHATSKMKGTSGTSQTGKHVRSGAPAGRHATSKPTGTSGTAQAGTSIKTGAPAGRHATSKSTSRAKKHVTPHKKQTTSETPMSSQ
jgi:hypothetical protein